VPVLPHRTLHHAATRGVLPRDLKIARPVSSPHGMGLTNPWVSGDADSGCLDHALIVVGLSIERHDHGPPIPWKRRLVPAKSGEADVARRGRPASAGRATAQGGGKAMNEFETNWRDVIATKFDTPMDCFKCSDERGHAEAMCSYCGKSL
jgi:hypothetical protein